jgi:hypothetical protein
MVTIFLQFHLTWQDVGKLEKATEHRLEHHDLFYCHYVQTGSGNQSVCYMVGIGTLSPDVERPGGEADNVSGAEGWNVRTSFHTLRHKNKLKDYLEAV